MDLMKMAERMHMSKDITICELLLLTEKLSRPDARIMHTSQALRMNFYGLMSVAIEVQSVFQFSSEKPSVSHVTSNLTQKQCKWYS